jgi:hypothetical protein
MKRFRIKNIYKYKQMVGKKILTLAEKHASAIAQLDLYSWRIDQQKQRIVENFPRNHFYLTELLQDSYCNVFVSLSLYNGLEGHVSYLQRAVQRWQWLEPMSLAVYEGSCGDSVRHYEIDGFAFDVAPCPPNSGSFRIDPWYQAIGFALIFRNQALLAATMKYQRQWADWITGTDETVRRLVDYTKLAFLQPDAFLQSSAPSDVASVYPAIVTILQVLACVYRGDEAGFEQAVRDASAQHASTYRKVWFKTYATFPTLLIGVVALAYDRYGWQLQHDNEFIPSWMVHQQLPALLETARAGHVVYPLWYYKPPKPVKPVKPVNKMLNRSPRTKKTANANNADTPSNVAEFKAIYEVVHTRYDDAGRVTQIHSERHAPLPEHEKANDTAMNAMGGSSA